MRRVVEDAAIRSASNIVAGPQPFDSIVDLAERRENERRRIDAFAAQSTNDRKAIEFWQPTVDDDYVIFAGDCMREPVFTIGR
jgi:hypothetical protein